MRFRIIVLLLLAVFAVGMTACGGGDEASPTPETVEGENGELETGPQETVTGEPEGGTAGQGDPEAGAEVFAAGGCGGCHVLEAAGTSGTVGPNLDESKPEYDLIVDRVTNGQGAMPSFKDQFSEEEIQNVAAYVFESTR
jgi:mono/diheme cytochrome c family protein